MAPRESSELSEEKKSVRNRGSTEKGREDDDVLKIPEDQLLLPDEGGLTDEVVVVAVSWERTRTKSDDATR